MPRKQFKSKPKKKTVRVPISERKPAKPHAARARTPSEKQLKRLTRQTCLAMYAEGKTPEQIAVTLGMRPQHVQLAIKKAVNALVKHYTDPTPEHTFVRFAAFQFGIIAKLQDACELFMADKRNRQYNALTQALRTQSEIYDKIVDKGLKFGVIEQKKATGEHRMTQRDLRAHLQEEMSVLGRLLGEVDDSMQMASVRVTQTSITFAPKLKKPLTDSRGIVRAVPDWKHRKKITDSRGNYVPIPKRTPEQIETLQPRDEHMELEKELLKSRGQDFVETHEGEVIPIETDSSNKDDEPTKKEPGKRLRQEKWLVAPRKASE